MVMVMAKEMVMVTAKVMAKEMVTATVMESE
jgi:hypothetical protein